MSSQPIHVTAPTLAPLTVFSEILESAWNSGVLTHNGPLVQKLEVELKKKFALPNVASVTNGTIAMQMALRALDILEGEIITTPFSWVATCSAIRWERCTPVFVDVNPDTFNIDEKKIAEKITKKTKAILPVHVFSRPCDVVSIDATAKNAHLKVIYDGAHALGVNYLGKSLLAYGDISTASFHATKIFNSGEGGACVSNSNATHERLKSLRFFGHDDAKDIVDDGLNGKLTEIHVALGLANLPLFDEAVKRRKQIFDIYFANLKDNGFSFQNIDPSAYNFSYMPIVCKSETQLLKVDTALKKENIFARRYFHPSLNTVKAISAYQACPQSERLASTILCLPSHGRLSDSDVHRISEIISKNA